MASDAGLIQIERTHGIHFSEAEDGSEAMVPISLDPGIDLRRTFFVSEVVQRWGKLPSPCSATWTCQALSVRLRGHGGLGDVSRRDSCRSSCYLVIDDSKRKIQTSGWRTLNERPIYFLEHRDGFYCRWCSVRDGMISLISDPASEAPVLTFPFPEDIEVIGQVVGVAMSLDPEKRRRTRS